MSAVTFERRYIWTPLHLDALTFGRRSHLLHLGAVTFGMPLHLGCLTFGMPYIWDALTFGRRYIGDALTFGRRYIWETAPTGMPLHLGTRESLGISMNDWGSLGKRYI